MAENDETLGAEGEDEKSDSPLREQVSWTELSSGEC